MTTDELLVELWINRIQLKILDDKLGIRYTGSVIDSSLMAELSNHKSVLINLIKEEYPSSDSAEWWSPKARITPAMLSLIDLTQQEIDQIISMVPGGAANTQDIYPLAPLQEGILFHHLMSEEGDPYLLASVFSFDKRSRLDSYITALQAVVDRHDILRTSVYWEGVNTPGQVVWRSARLRVEELEFDSLAGDVANQLYERFNPRRFRIDLRQAPLLRLYIAYDAQKDCWLLLELLHHLAGDHISLEIMQEEVQAYLLGKAATLPTPLPFRNLVAQARLGVSLQEHEAFFRQMLGDISEPTAPFGLVDVQGDGTGIEEGTLALDAALCKRLRKHARRLGVSAASLYHVAWAQVLAKAAGCKDVVFGTVLFGRMQGSEGSERIMGPFINTLPVRISINDEDVETAIRKVHKLLAELLRHEHAPLVLAQRCSSIPAPTPLFSALLNYRYSASPEQPSEDTMRIWEGVSMLRSEERTNYPLTLSVDDLGEGFALTTQTLAAVDPMRVCLFMKTALTSLADALETDSSVPVGALQCLPAAERQQLLYEWNGTRADFSSDRCVHQLFEEQVLGAPDATAVVFEEKRLSYQELNRRANRLAYYLRELGVGPDDRVAICVERGFEMIVAILAVLKAGGAYVPLDPAYPVERLYFMLEDATPVVVLTQQHLQNLFNRVVGHVPVLDLSDDSPWQHRADTNPAPNGQQTHHLAYVIYTSGSTGTPKGVMIEHYSLCNHISWQCHTFGFDSSDSILQRTPISFDASVWELWTPLAIGATMVLLPNEAERDTDSIARIIECNKITIAQFVPSLLQALIENHHRSALSFCRYIFCGGELLSPCLVRKLAHSTDYELINLYGPTETTIDATAWRCPDCFLSASAPIGRPISNTQVYILDGYGEPVPMGVAGEIYIGGAGVARGYLNRPDLTAEKFVRNPFTSEADGRMYRTGDLGRWLSDGNIEFLGRNDFQVKIRGFRIELGEIEDRLMQHDGIREAVVIAREDTPGDKRLVAYYRVADEQAPEVKHLRAHLAKTLPEYMVPAAYVQLDALPLTPNGKLDRKALPIPDGDAFAVQHYEAPQGETELRLAQIWADVLRLDKVGRHDNFFALGGHSLLAVRLIERTRRVGFKLGVRSLFLNSTIAELAAALVPKLDQIEAPPNLIELGADIITPAMLSLIDLTQQEIDQIISMVPGGAANTQDIYPLAPLQEGILFHHLMSEEGDPYLLASVFSFDKRSRLDSYITALQAVVDRHDILRTSVYWEGVNTPGQVVWRSARLRVEELEFDSLAGDVANQLYERFNPRRFRIDLRQAPLLRLYIAYDAQKDCWLLLELLHHLAGDHISLEIMQEEVQAYLLGKAATLPTPLPFRNLVAQARLGVSLQEHEAFFRQMLGDISEPTAPFGLVDVQGDGTGIEEGTLALDAALCKRLRKHARRLGVSAASLYHVAWAQVLAKAAGCKDVVFGTVLFGRMQGSEGSERIMGPFINTLPVRISINDEDVETAIRKVHKLLAELLRHEHAPLVLAQRCSSIPAPTPLFSALLNYRYSASPEQPSEDTMRIWEGVSMLRSEERTNYPLTLSVDDLGEGFALTTQTLAAVDPMRVCLFMKTALTSLADALETDSSVPVGALQCLPAAERQQLLYEWNGTRADFSSDRCVHQLFEEQVLGAPDATAVVFEEKRLSYQELNRRANRLAYYLRELGVGPDDRVAICVERGFEMIVAILAVLKAGGAYVPLDPAYPVERLYFMLEDATPVVVLTQQHLQNLFNRVVGHVPVLDLSDDSPWQHRADTNPAPNGQQTHHLAYVIYTSGSTGTPKGVMIEHANLMASNSSRILTYQHFKRFTHFALISSLAFDSAGAGIWGTLTTTGELHIPNNATVRDPTLLHSFIKENTINCFLCIPSLYLDLLTVSALTPIKDCLMMVIVAGDSCSKSLAQFSSDERPCTLLFNEYGPTEATIWATVYRCHAINELSTIPIGRPISNTQVYILDGYGEPVPMGVAGEIYIGGAGVARGYLNRPDLTAEKFVRNPFTSEADGRMYRTGDLGRWLSDGNIEFLGRNDFQVKIRGFRIELGEIEDRLMQHDGIREAVVIAREDTPGDKRLVAYYRVADEQAPEVKHLRAHLAKTLPEYMVPAAYVQLDALPLTPNGKLDRKALPIPDGDAFAVQHYEAPQGETELRLAQIWADVLRLDKVGRHDNFFALGGHSLLAVRLVTKLRSQLDVELPVREIFAYPALKDLAHAVKNALPAQLPPIVPVKRDRSLPLSFAQQRLWFLAQMEGVSETYHISLGLRLQGDLHCDALRRALDRIWARHEALRTSFVLINGEPIQQLAARDSHFALIEHDLSQHRDQDPELKSLVHLEARTPFNLERGPLIRGRLIRLHDNEHALLITMHHVVSDGWSIGVLMDELTTLYNAFRDNMEDPLPELSVQYADYAIWQRDWIEGGILKQQVDYWKSALAEAPVLLELPLDHPRPAEQSYAGAVTPIILNERLTAKLRDLSSKHGTTLYMTLLAAWAALLARLSGQQDILIGSPTANRGLIEIEALIGFFVNTLVLRLDLSSSPTVGELLAQTKRQAIAAQQHQDLPFEQVVELTNPVRSLSHSPLFQVMFAWQNAHGGQCDLVGLRAEMLDFASQEVAKFDLSLSLADSGRNIVGDLEYATSLFEKTTIARFLEYFRTLLESMVADDTVVIERLAMVPAAERQQSLYEWNDTRADFSSDRCVHQLFEEQVLGAPDATAVVFEEKRLSYQELNRRANRLAYYLRELGVGPDDRVAICVERGFEMIVAILAVLKAGGAYVPLDPAYPVERLYFMLEDATPVVVLTQQHLQNLFNRVVGHVPVLDLSDDSPWQHRADTDPAPNGQQTHHLAYVIYTSGSTGTPKGVMIEHANLSNRISWMNNEYNTDARDSILQKTAMSFDVSVWEFFCPLTVGAKMVISLSKHELDPKYLLDLLHEYDITLVEFVPSLLQALINHSSKRRFLKLRHVISGSEPLTSATVRSFYKAFPHSVLHNSYGPTEATIDVTKWTCSPVDYQKMSPIGRPISNTQVYILDGYGEPVPMGVAGEIYIGGAGVARGYLNRPDLTAEKFVRNPFTSEADGRMYRTGDLGRWLSDGNIEFLGRNDFQVKIRGFRIELGEIEDRLMQHDGIREAVVIAREDTPGDKRLVAYYRVADEQAPEVKHLRAHLAKTLPEYMVPAAYVQLDALPLTPNGKLDRKALPIPDGDAFAVQHYEAPQGETELRLAQIWADVLRLDKVGRHDNFFALGGHSLLAVRLIERTRRVGFKLSPVDLFRHSTIFSLAVNIDSKSLTARGGDNSQPKKDQ